MNQPTNPAGARNDHEVQLEDDFKTFAEENPEIAEALRVFDLSFAWYSSAVQALEGPAAKATVSTERTFDAYMD